MPVKHPFRLYLRSRLNVILSAAAALLIAISLLLLRPYVLAPIALILLAYAAVTAAVFFSRAGAREVVQESREDARKEIDARIARYAGIRERVAVLRLGDERVASAVEYFLQESGSYLEKCRQLGSYSPLANERIERVLDICQAFLGEKDESATGRRYGVQEEGAGGAQAAGRLADDIRECGAVIRRRVAEDLEGLTVEQRLAAMKELEGSQQ
jgi:hypothetical protein